jgi:hypothetical protein
MDILIYRPVMAERIDFNIFPCYNLKTLKRRLFFFS